MSEPTPTEPIETPAPAAPPVATDWRAVLPEDLRQSKSLSKFPDVATLAKSYVEMDRMRATANKPVEGLPVPNDTWTKSDWDQLFSKLGRPEKPEDYKFEMPEIPEGAVYDESLDKFFAAKAHEVGLTPKQAHELRRAYLDDQVSRLKAAQAEQAKRAEERKQLLERTLSGFGPDKEAMLDGARRIVQEFGGERLKEYLRETGLGDDPVLVEFLAKVGKAFADDRVILGGGSMGGSFRGSPSAALSEIARLKGDKEFSKSLLDSSHPAHKEAKARWRGLHEVAYPGEA